jgi:glycosyltransferase involved in cell wall biosynthesis
VDPGDVGGMADRLQELLADRALRRRLSAAGMRTVQQYSVKRTVPMMESVLKKALLPLT